MIFSEKLRFLFCILMVMLLVLSIPTMAVTAPSVDAKGAILINGDTGSVLYSYNGEERINPASTTKILTAYIILESVLQGRYSLSDTFEAGENIYYKVPDDATTANIQPGEILSVNDYLMCALLSSANEACNALAIYHSGSITAFVREMNAMAEELGCTGTHFENPSGLTEEEHYTTPSDMAKILVAASKNSLFVKMMSTQKYTVPETNMSEPRPLQTTNRHLLQSSPQYYEYTVLGKTGTTEAAGNCFVSMAKKDGITLVCAVFGAKAYVDSSKTLIIESFSETQKLYEWGFSEYTAHEVADSSKTLKTIPVKNGEDNELAVLVAKNDYDIVCTDSEFESQYDVSVEISDIAELEAPVKSGTQMGAITVRKDGEVFNVIPIVIKNSIELSKVGEAKQILEKNPWILAVAGGILIAVVIAVVLIIKTIKRKERAFKALTDSHSENLDRLAKTSGITK